MNVSIIDIGSNTVKMNIVQIKDNKAYEVLMKKTVPTRLSEGMSSGNILGENAVNRTLTALKDFKEISKEYSCVKIRALATAALRNAHNPEAVTIPAKEMGIDIEIISGDKEAYYEYIGVMGALNPKNCVILDTGGASSEINVVKDGRNVFAKSLQTGAVLLTEKFFTGETDFDSAKNYVKNLMTQAGLSPSTSVPQIIALGGTVRMLASIMKNGDKETNGYLTSSVEISELCESLMKKSVEEIKEMKGVELARADILKGGITPLCSLAEYVNAKEIVFSSSGLREGILYELLG